MRKLFSEFADFCGIDGLSCSARLLDSFLVPVKSSFFAFCLELLNEVLLSPADLRGEVAQSAEFTEGCQLYASHGIWDVLLLGGVIGSWDSFENFESAQSSSSSCSFMREHASDASPENTWRSTVVDESTTRIGEESFAQELWEFGFVSEERTWDVDAFATDDDDSLACIS